MAIEVEMMRSIASVEIRIWEIETGFEDPQPWEMERGNRGSMVSSRNYHFTP